MARLIGFLLLALFACIPAAAAGKDTYVGHYWNEDKTGIFKLELSGESIKGLTVWGKNPSTDINNPDPTLRSRPLSGIEFLWGFTYEAKKNSWSSGKVYDPNNGKTYDAKMSIEKGGSILKMRGYVGISLFGRTAKFERVKSEEMPTNIGPLTTE